MPFRSFLAALALALLLPVAVLAAPPASEVLLPNTVVGYVSTPDAQALNATWDATMYGQLLDSEAMRAFSEDFRRQLREKWSESRLQLGLTWEDIETIAQGEAAAALVATETVPATVLLLDTTGQADAAESALARIGRNLKQQGAKERTATIAGAKVTVFDLAVRRGAPGPKQACYFIRDELLVAADNLDVATGILGRWNGAGRDRLALHEPYQAVMQRLLADLGEAGPPPQVRWFAAPFPLADARRQLEPDSAPDEDAVDYLDMLRKEGFNGIAAAGGTIHFGAGEFDTLQRVVLLKPGPLKKSARMLDFPGAAPYPPQAWVPADVAVYIAAQWDIQNAFEMSKTLVNRLAGDDVFEDIIDSMKEDEFGPQIDLREDIIAHLGQKIVVLFDNAEPITAESEQRLFAVEATNPEAVQAAIDKLIESNEAARRHEVHGTQVWEIPPEEFAGGEEIEVEGVAEVDEDEEEEPAEEDFLAGSFITVAHGYVFIASHLDLLTKVLRPADQQTPIEDMPEFVAVDQAIRAELERRGLSQASFRGHSRTDREFHTAYEQVRSGQLPKSQSLVGWVLNAALGGNPDADREQRIDGSKLPEYEVARQYLGPAGWFAVTEESGWFLVNFTLRPAPAGVQAAAE